MAEATKGSKYQLEITPINQVGDMITLLVVCMIAGKSAPEGTEVKFDINAVTVTGPATRLDQDGRAEVTLKVPLEPSVTIGVRTVSPGGRAQVKVNTGAAKAKPDTTELQLVITENTIAPGEYLKTFAVYDKKTGKGVGGKTVRLIPRRPITVDGEVIGEPSGDFYCDIDVPETGTDVRVSTRYKRVEVDARVLGYNIHEEMRLFGPGIEEVEIDECSSTVEILFNRCQAGGRTNADKIRGMWKRSAFAWFVTLVFMIGVLAQFPFWVAPTVMVVLVAALTPLALAKEMTALLANWFPVRTFIGTNNRWLCWMIGLTLISGVVLYNTGGGQPMVQTAAETYRQEMRTVVDAEIDQRNRNMREYGLYMLDEELPDWVERRTEATTAESPALPERPTFIGSLPNDPQRGVWFTRLFSFLGLLVLTLVYGTLFAFRDELADKLYDLERVVREKADGSTGQKVAQVAEKAVEVGTAAAGAAAPGVFGAMTSALKEGLATGATTALFANWLRRKH